MSKYLDLDEVTGIYKLEAVEMSQTRMKTYAGILKIGNLDYVKEDI